MGTKEIKREVSSVLHPLLMKVLKNHFEKTYGDKQLRKLVIAFLNDYSPATMKEAMDDVEQELHGEDCFFSDLKDLVEEAADTCIDSIVETWVSIHVRPFMEAEFNNPKRMKAEVDRIDREIVRLNERLGDLRKERERATKQASAKNVK